jgi:hypothetical protein
MTAGRGLIHSEIPQQTAGRMEGFQLWVNLPARDKLIAPWYRNFTADELPSFLTELGVRATVIAGESQGVTGAVTREATAPLFLDLHLPAGAHFAQALQPDRNAFIYVYRGAVGIAGTRAPTRHMAILANDPGADGVLIEATDEARVLLIAGQPLCEPIVQHGPFVMNSLREIQQAVRDYQSGLMA